MKIILLKDIKDIGRAGDVKNVKDGYARNHLLPNKLAKLATDASLREVESKKERASKENEEIKNLLEKVQVETKDKPLNLPIKVGDKGEIFGSVMANDIKKALITRFVELKAIDNLEIKKDHLREVGIEKVEIDLGQGIAGSVTIEIVPEAQK